MRSSTTWGVGLADVEDVFVGGLDSPFPHGLRMGVSARPRRFEIPQCPGLTQPHFPPRFSWPDLDAWNFWWGAA
jgi:hypothetical protein